MARPSKKQLAEAAKAEAPTKTIIDLEAFIRVRESTIANLKSIQDLLHTFTEDYQKQTSLLLGEGVLPGQPVQIPAFDNVAQLLPQQTMLQALAPVPPVPVVEEKKERKKRTHDPNAPKRPLTPYFLYMQTARPIIASDLGENAPKGAVQEEGQRRWSTMNAHDKGGWDRAYQYNLRLYNARVHSYKSGNEAAKLMTDDEALRYADEFSIPMPTSKEVVDTSNDQEAIAEQLQQQHPVEEAEEEEEEEQPAAAKTPKSAKKATGKRKTATPVVEADVTATPGSPDKKRKRPSKVTEEKEPEPKKSGRKKAKSG